MTNRDILYITEAVDKALAIARAPICEIHRTDNDPPYAVLIESTHFNQILDLIPEGKEITDLVMHHGHLVGDEDNEVPVTGLCPTCDSPVYKNTNQFHTLAWSFIGALRLIAQPKRPDGTYNYSREACTELARKVLDLL